MKSGYILLEILISTAIAAVVSSGLIVAFYQLNRANEKLNDLIVLNTRVNIMNYQFERDITGICTPIMEMIASHTHQENKKQSHEKNDEYATDSREGKEQSKMQSEQQDQKSQRIQKNFYGVNKGENIELLTFVTDNPLLIYWGPQAGSPIIRFVRVTYTLESDVHNKNSYILYRQESSEVTYESDGRSHDKKMVKKYALLHGIKKCTVTYQYALPEKNEETDKKNIEKKQNNAVGFENGVEKKKKPVIQYERVSEWKDEQKEEIEKSKQQDNEKKRPEVPDFVQVHIELWNLTFTHATTFDFVYHIMVRPVPIYENNKNYGS